MIAGNHEYDFCKDRGTTDCAILKVTQDTRNVVFLNNSSLVLENHRILGSTLYFMEHPLFSENVKWIEEEKEKATRNKEPLMVLTHHLPSYKLIVQKYQTARYKKVHHRYATNLEYLMSYPIHAWLCGHSHCTFSLTIHGVLCGINALGYQREQKDIEIRVEDIELY
jgi:hypothetical protein